MYHLKSLLSLILLLALTAWAGAADNLFTTDLYLNGNGAGEVNAVFNDGRLYVDARSLARLLNVALVDPGAESVTLNGRSVARLRRVNQSPYVDVVDTLVALGLRGEIRENGAALSIWSADGLAQRLDLGLSIMRSDKSSSPSPNFESRLFTVALRNQSKNSGSVTGEQFYVIDSNGEVYDCETEFQTALQPAQTATLERLLFEVPAGADLKYMVVLIGDLEVARVRL